MNEVEDLDVKLGSSLSLTLSVLLLLLLSTQVGDRGLMKMMEKIVSEMSSRITKLYLMVCR